MGKDRFDDPERRVDVGLYCCIEVFARDIEDRLAALLAARIVDEDVQPAETAQRVGHQLLAERFAAQIARQRQADPSFGFNQRDHLARVWLLVRQIVYRHIGAFPSECYRGGAAHAGVAARNQGFTSEQAVRAAITLFAVVRPRLHLTGEARPGLGLRLERRFGIFGDGVAHRRGSRLRIAGRSWSLADAFEDAQELTPCHGTFRLWGHRFASLNSTASMVRFPSERSRLRLVPAFRATGTFIPTSAPRRSRRRSNVTSATRAARF